MNRPFAVALITLLVRSTMAEDRAWPTNTFDTSFRPLGYELVSLKPSKNFWTNMLQKMTVDPVYANRFGQQADIDWFRAGQVQRYDIRDHMNSAGRDVVRKLSEDGLREAFISQISFESMLGVLGDTKFSRWLDGFIKDTVGNTLEEQLSFVQANSSPVSLAQMMEYDEDDSPFKSHFGLRDTYGYWKAGIGRESANSVYGSRHIIDFNLRARVMFSSFSQSGLLRTIKLEAQAIMPLPHNCQLILGGNLYPEQYIDSAHFDSVHYSPSGSIRFEHIEKSHRFLWGSEWIGFSSGPGETILSIGLFTPLDRFNKHLRKS